MTIGIVGLGYVGLPLAVAFAEAGQRVVGVDTNPGRVAQLRAGDSYIEDIPSEQLQAVASRIEATTRAARLGTCDAIIICVPTPLTANREPDLGPLLGASQVVADVLQAGQLVVLESTTYPGTTRERVLPILEETGLVAGRDFHLAFSPERVDPGNETHSLHNTPKIIGGLTPACRDRAEAVYGLVCQQVVPVTTPEVAEMAKLLENIFRSVNIALVNELARLADRMQIDIHEVIDAAATKPFGFMRFDPGPGMGGHCLPVDPFYLSWKARELDFATEFIELAGKVNQTQPYFCVELAERALNEQGKAVKGSKIAVLGVAYKPGVGDTRESPALKIVSRLQQLGADVAYSDPYVPALPACGLTGATLEEALTGADLALIVTAHTGIDHAAVAARVPTIDFRGVTRTVRASARPPAEIYAPLRGGFTQPTEVAA
jgi:UDP-N-acetyl-D-glucosamine dehydrogenase